jgi:four helix bundle protein
MGVRHYKDLVAWQLAEQFKDHVFALVDGSVEVQRDLRFRSQITEAASAISKDLAEGFLRFSPASLMQFIDYACGSLAEAERRLHDGRQRGLFTASACEPAFRLGCRCLTAMIRLKQSQQRYLRDKESERKRSSKPCRRPDPRD